MLVQYLLPKPVDWNHTYQKKSKSPFGCYAIFELMEGAFANNVITNNQTIYNLREDKSGKSTLVLVDRSIELSKTDLRTMMDFLNDGNKVFIAANVFDGEMASLLHLKTQADFFEFFAQNDSVKNSPGAKVKLLAKNYSKKNFTYSKLAWASTFTNFDSTYFKVLGSCDNKPFLLKGRSRLNGGELYLMSFPDIFANYFIVNNNNRELAYLMMSLAKNNTLIWDEHYKTFNEKKNSSIKFILENDSLYAAWLLLIFTIFAYMIFEGRRRQRAVPVLEPVKNTTLEFVNVVSHVYFNGNNHQSIAEEKIKYFYESVRKKFGVSTANITDGMLDEISALSGVDLSKVRQLFVYCEKIKSSSEISQFQLAELNRQINNFNKHSLR